MSVDYLSNNTVTVSILARKMIGVKNIVAENVNRETTAKGDQLVIPTRYLSSFHFSLFTGKVAVENGEKRKKRREKTKKYKKKKPLTRLFLFGGP